MIASIRMTPRIHHRFGSHAQDMLGIRGFKFTEWTFNHSLARKTKKQERETEMLQQAEVQGQAEVRSQPEGQATPSVKRQASKSPTRVQGSRSTSQNALNVIWSIGVTNSVLNTK